MDMDFAVSGPLVRRSRLVSGSCPSTRTFALRFLQTSPRGDSPCVVTNPSPPSGWVEDFHLQVTEHAQHTTKSLRDHDRARRSRPVPAEAEPGEVALRARMLPVEKPAFIEAPSRRPQEHNKPK